MWKGRKANRRRRRQTNQHHGFVPNPPPSCTGLCHSHPLSLERIRCRRISAGAELGPHKVRGALQRPVGDGPPQGPEVPDVMVHVVLHQQHVRRHLVRRQQVMHVPFAVAAARDAAAALHQRLRAAGPPLVPEVDLRLRRGPAGALEREGQGEPLQRLAERVLPRHQVDPGGHELQDLQGPVVAARQPRLGRRQQRDDAAQVRGPVGLGQAAVQMADGVPRDVRVQTCLRQLVADALREGAEEPGKVRCRGTCRRLPAGRRGAPDPCCRGRGRVRRRRGRVRCCRGQGRSRASGIGLGLLLGFAGDLGEQLGVALLRPPLPLCGGALSVRLVQGERQMGPDLLQRVAIVRGRELHAAAGGFVVEKPVGTRHCVAQALCRADRQKQRVSIQR